MAPPLLVIRELALPVRAPLAAAHDETPSRDRNLTVVSLTHDGAVGWGECSALSRVGYTHESSATAFDLLSHDTTVLEPGGAARLVERFPMAIAALEMAEIDLRLKQNGVSLADYLGVDRRSVPAGATLSLGSIDEVRRQARELVGAGIGRLKVKVVPRNRQGWSSGELVASLRAEFPQVEIHVDANGSFDRSSISEVTELYEAGAIVIEQPFPPQDVALAAQLVREGVPIVADEAATDAAAVRRLVATRACIGVSAKSSRLGGLYRTFELMSWCFDEGVAVVAGGMQESGLGRHALAVVAAHEACTITGDVGPARRWLAEDPWPDLRVSEGSVEVPSSPGVAPTPNPDTLDRLTIRQTTRKLRS